LSSPFLSGGKSGARMTVDIPTLAFCHNSSATMVEPGPIKNNLKLLLIESKPK